MNFFYCFHSVFSSIAILFNSQISGVLINYYLFISAFQSTILYYQTAKGEKLPLMIFSLILSLVLCSLIFLSQSPVNYAGIPHFATLQDTNEIIYLSTSRKVYQKIPNEQTLAYVSNGLTPKDLQTVPLSTLQTLKYEQLKDYKSSTSVQTWDDATDRISDKLRLIQDDLHMLDDNILYGNLCNPAVLYFKNRYLVTSRRADSAPFILFTWIKKQDDSSQFYIDEQTSYLGIGPKSTDIVGLEGFENNGQDPRVMMMDDNTFILIRADTSMKDAPTPLPIRLKLAYFTFEAGNVLSNTPDKLKLVNDTILQPPLFDRMQEYHQNHWTPFTTADTNELLFVYTLYHSFTVIRQIPDEPESMEIVSEVSNDGKVVQLWQFGRTTGGTPAYRIGKTRYLSFFHSHIETPDTAQYWHSMYIGAYVFSSQRPYRLLGMSRVPLYHDTWFQGPWLNIFQSLYIFFPTNFHFIEVKTGKILLNLDHLDVCETYSCLSQYNVSLSYGFNMKHAFIVKMNLASLMNTMHFFDSGDLPSKITDIDDIVWTTKNQTDRDEIVKQKKCRLIKADFTPDYNPIAEGYQYYNVTTSLLTHFQVVLKPYQLLERHVSMLYLSPIVKETHSLYLPHSPIKKSTKKTRIEEVRQWLSQYSAMTKIVEWHMSYLEKVKTIESERVGGVCVDIGAKTGFYSLLMSTHTQGVGKQRICEKVHVFESRQSLIDSIKLSVCLNDLHDSVMIHHTSVSIGEHVVKGLAQTIESKALPTVDDCVYGSNTVQQGKEWYPLIKIDAEGREIHVLQGMKSILSMAGGGTSGKHNVEGVIIDMFPSGWEVDSDEQNKLTVTRGYELMHGSLGGEFIPHIVLGSSLMCPTDLYIGSSNVGDSIQIDKDTVMKVIPWNEVVEVLVMMKVRHAMCSFVFLPHSQSLGQRLQTLPLSH